MQMKREFFYLLLYKANCPPKNGILLRFQDLRDFEISLGFQISQKFQEDLFQYLNEVEGSMRLKASTPHYCIYFLLTLTSTLQLTHLVHATTAGWLLTTCIHTLTHVYLTTY